MFNGLENCIRHILDSIASKVSFRFKLLTDQIMIPKWQQTVFTLHSRIFTFMSPLPLAWLANESKFVYIHTYRRWISFLFWITMGSVVSVGCAYDVITCFKFGRSDMDMPIGLMLLTAGIVLCLNSVLWTFLVIHPYTISGLNQLLFFKAKLNCE